MVRTRTSSNKDSRTKKMSIRPIKKSQSPDPTESSTRAVAPDDFEKRTAMNMKAFAYDSPSETTLALEPTAAIIVGCWICFAR